MENIPVNTPLKRIFDNKASNLRSEDRLRIPDDQTILQNIKPSLPEGSRPQFGNVTLAPVSTYIYRKELSKTLGNTRVVFPTFASHWAIVITEPGFSSGHIYHLLFEDPRAAQLSAAANISRRVKFATEVLEEKPEGAKQVGMTRFTHDERVKIGKAMVDAFGDYHRVFWNCQHFARLYLSVITDGAANFEEWNAGEASNLFLCAFLVTSPLASTNKAAATKRVNEVIAKMSESTSDLSEREVLDASDEAITLAQHLVAEDYARDNPQDVYIEESKGFTRVFARIIELITGR